MTALVRFQKANQNYALVDIYPRKVYYFPVTGKVRVKKLRTMHNTTITDREKTYLQDLRDQAPHGEVDLF